MIKGLGTGLAKGLTVQMAAIAVMVAVLVSCVRDDKQLDNTGSVTLYPVIMNRAQTVVQTRADIYTTYQGASREAIFAHAIAYSSEYGHQVTYDRSGTFNAIGDEGLWRSTVNVIAGQSYNLYCYTTIPGAHNYALTFNNPGDVALSFQGLDILGNNDPLVSTSAEGRILPDNPNFTDSTDPDYVNPVTDYPTPQSMLDNQTRSDLFSIGQAVRADNDDPNPRSTKVFLTMEHLFAKATISFKVASKYDEIRTIRLTSAILSMENASLSGTYKYQFATGNLTKQDGSAITMPTGAGSAQDAAPIDIIGGISTMVERDYNNTEVTLTTTSQAFGWFTFLPISGLNPVSLTVQYNVYDKNDNLIRENCQSTNNNILRGITGAAKGNDYKINITVNPTYLYQLTDDDVELELTLDAS